jgi:hypothetical protein
MSAIAGAPEPPLPPRELHAPRVGRLVGGLILVTVGVGWLLEIWGVDVPWDAVLPGALVVIGAALLLAAGRGDSQAGLITTGVVLTFLLLVGAVVNIPLGGGVGARTVHPTSHTGILEEYRLGIGELTLDLSDVRDVAEAFPVRSTHATVGVGHLVVILPAGASVRVAASAGLGNVEVFDVAGSGLDVHRVVSRIDPTSNGGLDLVLSVGLGQVEVRRG